MWSMTLLFVLGALQLSNVFGACQNGEVSHKGSCYYFGNTVQSPHSARDICKGRGGQLASINSADEDNFLRAQAKTHLISVWAPMAFAVGGSDEAGESTWLWADGTSVSTYMNWGPGQPDNYLSAEDCMILLRPAGVATTFQWYDVNCDIPTELFICERSDGSRSVGVPMVP